jgi:hypothetical protein
MHMPSADLVAAYERTEYRVRLGRGGCATIRVGEPLPETLQAVLPAADAPWGFITAWNPYSEQQSPEANRSAQRELLKALHNRALTPRIFAGMGVGADADADGRRWREPSLFVAGTSFELLDALMLRFEQHAIVRGIGNSPAQLRLTCSVDRNSP